MSLQPSYNNPSPSCNPLGGCEVLSSFTVQETSMSLLGNVLPPTGPRHTIGAYHPNNTNLIPSFSVCDIFKNNSLRWQSQTINYFSVNKWVAFSEFIMLCCYHYHLYLIPEHSITIVKPCTHSSSPQLLATTQLCSVSMDLPLLDISCNRVVHYVSCVTAPHTQHGVPRSPASQRVSDLHCPVAEWSSSAWMDTFCLFIMN